MINKAYFVRYFKESSIFIIIMALINIVFSASFLNEFTFTESRFQAYGLLVILIPSFIFAFISPLFVLSYKSSRNEADVYYSLPITRLSLLNTRILVILIDIFISLLPIIFVTSISFYSNEFFVKNANHVFYWFLPLTAFLSFLPTFFINLFVANKRNKLSDKVIYILLYNFAFSLISLIFLTRIGYTFYTNFFMPMSPFVLLCNSIQGLIFKGTTSEVFNKIYFGEDGINYVPTLIFSLLAILAIVLLELDELKVHSENIGQPSDSWFGYKIFIPLSAPIVYGIFYGIFNNFKSHYLPILIEAFTIILRFIFYFLYKGKIVLKKDALLFGGITILINIPLIINYYLF